MVLLGLNGILGNVKVKAKCYPFFENKKFLISKHDVLQMQGKMSYNERFQAWNTIRFKTDLIREFPQLMEKRSSFYYHLIFYRDYFSLEKSIKEMKNKGILPILLFFYQENISSLPSIKN